MALPEQIRKQTEAVQELYKQLNVDDNTGEDQSSADGTATPDAPAADENTASNSATPAPAGEQKPGAEPHLEDFAQKYKTLQGMYNAEVPRLHQQNREMTQRLQQMEQLLATMSQAPAASATPQPVVDKFVTDKDVEEYGDSIDMMRKVSREELSSVAQRLSQIEQALRQMQTSVVPQVQAVAQRQHVSAEQQFWAELGSAVPTFRDVNANEAFQAWLLEMDPLTGITRQTYLDDAQRALDARRVANIFRTWMEASGQAAVAQSPGKAPTAELERQVSPGRSRSAGTPAAANQGKMYTPQDIQKFFNDVRAGKYKGREQERSRIERDIFAAQRENRIQMSA